MVMATVDMGMEGVATPGAVRRGAALIALATALLLASPGAPAVEPLASAELAAHCAHYRRASDSPEGVFCVRYIQGFIDGAEGTDERVTLNVAAEYERDESFTQRAARTRVSQQLDDFGPSYYAGFCLGAPVPLAEVVDRVVQRLQDEEAVALDTRARDLVYRTLRQHYPCRAPTAAGR